MPDLLGNQKNSKGVDYQINIQMKDIQKELFQDMQEKGIFNKAQLYAYQYIDQVFNRNVFPEEKALINLKYFEEDMPIPSTDSSQVMELLHNFGSPATIAQLGGRYFGFVCGGSIPIGLAAKNLSTYWDQNTAMHVLSPLASKLETVVEKWLTQLLELPERVVAGFVSGTSSASFCGLAAARYRLLRNRGWDINEQGLFDAPKLRVITSKQAHSTIIKAIGLLGFGKINIEWVDVDEEGRIIPELIPELDNRSILVLQAGNVNSGSFDSFEKVINKANQAQAWVHIDGAFGLWAAVVEKLKHLTKGIEKANSWAVDGHKTLNTPYDCGVILCEDKEALVSALHMSGSYIVLSEERDGMLYTPEMSRRARIIEIWAVLKYLGKNGINEMVYGLHERAVQFSEELSRYPEFKILNQVVFNQVLVCCENDDLTKRLIKKIQDLRECWVGGSSWNGKEVIRISICSWATTKEDVTGSVLSFVKALDEIKRGDYC